MRVRFWGTRGSCPSPGPNSARFGGNTTCVELRTDDEHLVVFDAGTGIRELGRSLMQSANGSPIEGDVFFSHAHWDHIQGLPFFTPAFRPGNHFRLFGSPSLERSLEVVLRQQMSPVVFPVAFDDLRARMEFGEFASHRVSGQGYELRAINVRHPGGALGFRIWPAGDPSRSIVFIPDNELDRDGDHADSASTRAALIEFARGATILVHDAMYTAPVYIAGGATLRTGTRWILRSPRKSRRWSRFITIRSAPTTRSNRSFS
jgi:ribonuclease BN (tRNA processing enzyme)